MRRSQSKVGATPYPKSNIGLGVWLKWLECLPSKCKALSSNSSTGKKRKALTQSDLLSE
jgi:hypothetical protein